MPAAADGLISALENNFTTIDLALKDLTDEEFHRIPADDCNSVAWILWHLSRVIDSFIHTRLRDLPQLWDAGNWERHFTMPADGENRGLGWTHRMVCDWQPPSRGVQMDYFEQVRSALREYLPSLTEAPDAAGEGYPAGVGAAQRGGGPGPDDLGLRIPRRPDCLPARDVQGHGLAPLGRVDHRESTAVPTKSRNYRPASGRSAGPGAVRRSAGKPPLRWKGAASPSRVGKGFAAHHEFRKAVPGVPAPVPRLCGGGGGPCREWGLPPGRRLRGLRGLPGGVR